MRDFPILSQHTAIGGHAGHLGHAQPDGGDGLRMRGRGPDRRRRALKREVGETGVIDPTGQADGRHELLGVGVIARSVMLVQGVNGDALGGRARCLRQLGSATGYVRNR